MKKIDASDAVAQSADIVAQNVDQLRVLFPEAFTEGKVNFDVLKQLLGGVVDEREEKYGLNWHGKRKARQLALTPSIGTLRPCPEESVDWDTTQNLMIEGDNLEVLKLLQKSYADKVKLIYIDPPYNTGRDFVYPDDFRDNIKNYLELTEQVESGNRISSNTEASGRFHTDWLNMMFPRLRLARSLLSDEGVLFISIDDTEVANARQLLNEVFGEECFLAGISWQKLYSGKADATHFGRFHEYILVYAKNTNSVSIRMLPRTKEMDARYSNPDNDERGPWLSNDLTAAEERTNGHYEIRSPNGASFDAPKGKHWLYAEDRMQELIRDNRIWFGKEGTAFPRLKRFLSEVQQGTKPSTVWSYEDVGSTDSATKELKRIFPELNGDFQTPKPIRLMDRILEIATGPDGSDIVLDFFAGSGTMGEAVIRRNAVDGGNRRFILAQFPEPTGRFDFPKISDITIERLRRCISDVKKSTKGQLNLSPEEMLDLGCRLFKLDASNIQAWHPNPENIAETLDRAAEHLKTDRTEQDILFELLLKLGLDLTIPVEKKAIVGKTVHNIGAGALMVCLDAKIGSKDVEPLAHGIADWHRALAPAGETTIVFRDSAFADDVAKTNLTAILQQHGLENVRSL